MEGEALSGRVDALWTKRAHGGVMDPRHDVTFVAGQGIAGNTCRSSTRQVTIIAAEQWRAMMAELGADADPAGRRANVLVSGVSLAGTRGRMLRLGAVRVRIRGETRPCERMDEAVPGLRSAMDTEWRGGVFGEVLDDGIVTVGDVVAWEPVERMETAEMGERQPGA